MSVWSRCVYSKNKAEEKAACELSILLVHCGVHGRVLASTLGSLNVTVWRNVHYSVNFCTSCLNSLFHFWGEKYSFFSLPRSKYFGSQIIFVEAEVGWLLHLGFSVNPLFSFQHSQVLQTTCFQSSLRVARLLASLSFLFVFTKLWPLLVYFIGCHFSVVFLSSTDGLKSLSLITHPCSPYGCRCILKKSPHFKGVSERRGGKHECSAHHFQLKI